MKVKFELNLDVKIEVQKTESLQTVALADTKIIWNRTMDGSLEKIDIVFEKIDITRDSSGAILTTTNELDEKAFKIATYIVNKIFLKTGVDALNPESVLYNSPSIFPENEEEKVVIEKSKKQGFNSITGEINVIVPLQLEKFNEDFRNSKAIALYADALRARSSFQKYELLYKVIEYFFPSKESDDMDLAVSDYCKKFNPTYGSLQFISSFRRLRNRCIHSGHKKHTNPENLASIREVINMVPKIDKLVNLLINDN